MNRRDLLKAGVLAGVGGSGCASLLSNPASVGAGEMEGFLGALDGALASIGAKSLFEQFLPQTPNEAMAARVKYSEELTKKTLRSMLLVGSVQELPREQQQHEGVQQRLRDSMNEFDDAMFGMTSMLEGLSPTDRTTVSKALRDDPQLGMRIMGSLDEEAATFGVSLKQRTKLRGLSVQACSRLRQSPDLAIAEFTGKMHKVAARHGAREELQRRTTAAIGASLVWQAADEEGRGSGAAVGGGSKRECVDDKVCAPGETCQNHREITEGNWTRGQCLPVPPKKKSSKGVLTAGGVMMGLAATGFLISVAVGSGSSVGLVVGATIGAILGTIGIVILIVGLIMLATGN